MPTYCVVEALHTEWLITTALDRQECIQQGGVIQERGSDGVCGASSAATGSLKGLSDSGIQGPASALMTLPLRMFHSAFSESPFVKRLEHLNAMLAHDVEGIFAHDPTLGREITSALIKASFLAAGFSGSSTESLSKIRYTPETHESFVKVAENISRRTKNEQLRSEIKQVVEKSRIFIGKNLQQIKAALQEPDRSA